MAEGRKSAEFAAIPITIVLLGVLLVVLLAASAGAGAFVALGIVGAAALGVVALVYMRQPHHPAAPAVPSLPEGAAPLLDDGVRRILVIADDACTPEDLGSVIAGGGNSRTQAFVVAPALGSRTARWTGDESAYQDAAQHLEATLQALRALNVDATGHVGAHDPLQAADDGLREFPADEVVFAVHPDGETNWLEEGVAAAAGARYPIPVRAVRVPSSGA